MGGRPVTTLFMLMSVDGKISTGACDDLDFDMDLPMIAGVREGLQQYYDIEQTTDLWSLNSGRVQAKMGVNEKPFPAKTPVSFVLIDNHHLTAHGVTYFAHRAKELVVVTANPAHPALSVEADNLHALVQERFDPVAMLSVLKERFGCQRLTIQTGGTLNGVFLRHKLIDWVDIVVAPVLVGGGEVSSLIDGPSLRQRSELDGLGALALERAEVLEHSYLRLRYRVIS